MIFLRDHLLAVVGAVLVLLGCFSLIIVTYPILKEESSYLYYSHSSAKDVSSFEPIDPEFGIVIPKIRANAPIIGNVDPFNQSEYQQALTKGVAHAVGTDMPGGNDTIFLFAHSSSDMFWASRYNSVFYLINKLNQGDEILLYRAGKEYRYLVNSQKIVDASEVSYLSSDNNSVNLILMTCWPPGTPLKRYIVEAELVQ